MSRSFRDWVVEVSSTTGTGAYTLGGVPAGTSYFTARQRYDDGDNKLCFYVRNANRTKWEKNRFGTLAYGVSPGTDTLSRNVVESTNGDAPVSWVIGDLPLRIYVAPDSDALEFAITMGLGATRPGILRYGLWPKEATPSAGYQQLTLQDGAGDPGDIPVGVVNSVAHKTTLYGMPRGSLGGLGLSRSSATVLGIAAGECLDSTNVVGIYLAAFTKSTAGAWAAGSAGNGMGNGLTIANSTWYHVFAILNAGAADVYFDTSITAANKPTGTTHFRRIGSFLTNGSAQIIAFKQIGDDFFWTVPVNNYSATGTGGTVTLTVPTGLNVKANVRVLGTVGAIGARNIVLHSLDQTAMTPNTPGGNISISWGAETTQGAGEVDVWTNTSAQIALVASGSTNLELTTNGWSDRRGRDD